MNRDQTEKQLKFALLGVIACLCLVAFRFAGGEAQRLAPYLADPVISVTEDAPSDPDARADYETLLQDANFHAAFALGNDGEYGWGDNYATQDMADFAAMAWCEEYGTGCRIIARVAPAEPLELEGQPLSKTAARAVAEYPDHRGKKALALSDTGAWGMAWGRSSAKDAAESAFEFCAESLTGGFPDGRTFGSCRLVWFD